MQTKTLPPMTQDQIKQAVARAAIQFVPYGEIIGVGTGSTANYFIDALADIKAHIPAAVASSEATAARLKAVGIAVVELNTVTALGVYVDGADEINAAGHMIKGGGAALTREKIVAAVAKQFICIADASKCVSVLGAFPLPVEVIPMASAQIMRQFTAWGGAANIRMKDGQPLMTDNGNVIVDVRGLAFADATAWEARINALVGVVSVGLFAARGADIALIGNEQGVQTLRYT